MVTILDVMLATAADVEEVLALLVGAATWLKEQGIRQWSHYLEDAEGERQEIREAIDRGEVYLVRHRESGQAAGTITLQAEPSDWDRAVWGDLVHAVSALYVHRLAVNRAFAGQGVGDRMLDWAEEQGRALGKAYLRLDCVGHNERLNAYYARRYTFRGEASHIGMRFHLYERAI